MTLVFADVELVLVELVPTLDAIPAGTVLPEDLAGSLPFCRVTHVGGNGELASWGTSPLSVLWTVDLDFFGPDTDRSAWQHATTVWDAMLARPHRVTMPDEAIVPVDGVQTVSWPAERPWADPGVRRWGGTCRVKTRRSKGPNVF